MKRLICLLLCAALLFGILGCASDTVTPEDPVHFYYPRTELKKEDYFSEYPIIVPELREASGHRDNPEYLLEQYLSGPTDSDLKMLFPLGTRLISFRTIGNSAMVALSGNYARLTGIDLSVANACLAMTVLDILDDDSIETVSITASGALMDGQTQYQIHRSDLLLIDDSVDKLKDSLVLYLTDQEQTQLRSYTVTINVTSGNSACAMLLEMLTDVDESTGFLSPLPEGTQLLGVSVSDGLCTVNFSPEFESNISQDSTAQYLALQSITNTLTQLNYVDGVHFYCDGSRLLHYGTMDTSDPWVWDDRCVGSTAGDSFYADLCLSTGSTPWLVPVRLSFTPEEHFSKTEQVLNALLSYETYNGFENPIPEGTEILRVMNYDNLCVIDLSGEFLSKPEKLQTAIRSVIATVFSLGEIASVRLIVEGAIPDGEYEEYFTVYTPESDWFA